MESLSPVFTVEWDRATNLLDMVIVFVPKLLLAISIWFLARLLAKAIKSWLIVLFEKLWLENVSKSSKIHHFLKKTSLGSLSQIVANIVYILVYLTWINIAFEILWLDIISELLSDLIAYIPSLFVALAILVFGAVLAKYVKELVEAANETTGAWMRWLGRASYVVMMVFVLVTALKQAEVDITFLTDNINTIVMWIMLALWLAFGLWWKDKAKELIEKYL